MVPAERGLQPEGRHPSRGVAASGFRPLRNIPHCCLPQESGPCLSPSVAGRPLRPATRRRLGRPSPHQQADRPRAHPPPKNFPPQVMRPGVISGISPGFPELSQSGRQVTHVLLTRAPCAHSLYCYRKLRTRLACVKHAASVRSEPGSNSRLKLVVLKIKIPAEAGTRTSKRTF